MNHGNGHSFDLSPYLQDQLRLIGRIALVVSLVAATALLLTLWGLFSGQPQGDYYRIIQALTRSQEQLPVAMLIGGALIVSLAGLMTWFMVLYSSARITGPLYRFARNLELEISEGPVQTVQLRSGDHLQALSGKLATAADNLGRHYADQERTVAALQRSLAAEPAAGDASYPELLQQLKNILDRKSP